MFLNGMSTIGWTFFSLAIICGFVRFGIKQADKIEESKKRERLDDDLKTLLATHANPTVDTRTYPKIVH